MRRGRTVRAENSAQTMLNKLRLSGAGIRQVPHAGRFCTLFQAFAPGFAG